MTKGVSALDQWFERSPLTKNLAYLQKIMRYSQAKRILTSATVALVCLCGATFGRYLLLEQQDIPKRYYWQALGIEFFQVAPFGALPAGLLAFVAIARKEQREERRLKALIKSNELTASEVAAVAEAIALLEVQDEK